MQAIGDRYETPHKNAHSDGHCNRCFTLQFLVSIAFNLMGSFMPFFINNELNETLIEATGWTGTSSFIASTIMAIIAPFWGWMCDHIGTKKILLFVLAGNIIVYSGIAFSTNVLQIVCFRALQGGFGGMSTVMFAIVATSVPSHDLKRALSYQMAAMTMGGLVAPGIGGVMAAVIRLPSHNGSISHPLHLNISHGALTHSTSTHE